LCDWHISFFGWLTLIGRIKTANINEVLFIPLYLGASDGYAYVLAQGRTEDGQDLGWSVTDDIEATIELASDRDGAKAGG
jgi:hypothetical protein